MLAPALSDLLILTLAGCVVASCPGTSIKDPKPFWKPSSSDDPWSPVPHEALPYQTSTGYTINAGNLGISHLANVELLRKLDAKAKTYGEGLVDTDFGLPTATTGGWSVQADAFHQNFNNGLQPEDFNVLLQKESNASNVKVASDTVNGVLQNVVQLSARAGPNPQTGERMVKTGAILQTAELFASGRYEVVAKFPAVEGLAFAVWSFHYERHLESSQLPHGQIDSQFVPNITGWISRTNHEIDIEMPASCSGMCQGGGCPGQFDTMNINNYIFTNANSGTGPAYSNLCVRAPEGTAFIDGQYHSYAFEWHSGDSDQCQPHVDFFFDGQYIGTNDVFVPSRGSRLTFGIWPAGKNWVGTPEWDEVSAYIAQVNICPFNEPNDSMYPQIYDQPTGHDIWVDLPALPPVVAGLPPSDSKCPGAATCNSTASRPIGCPCGNRSRTCASDCCDFNATPDPDSGVCAFASLCAQECKSSSRPMDCKCNKDSQCKSKCCQASKCVDSSECLDPCTASTNRPLNCPCNLTLDCASGCCDYNAAPGPTAGLCAQDSVCTAECQSDSRPVGCSCSDDNLCQTSCCSHNVCKTAESCPTPSGCAVDENKPVGCSCTHSWQCASEWCDGHCELH